LQAIYNYLPTTLLEALGGLAMCFFGGLSLFSISVFDFPATHCITHRKHTDGQNMCFFGGWSGLFLCYF